MQANTYEINALLEYEAFRHIDEMEKCQETLKRIFRTEINEPIDPEGIITTEDE